MFGRILFLMLSFFVAATGFAQQTMTLSQAVDYALSNHTDVRIAELSIKDAEWQIKENRATAYPQLSLGINASHFLLQPAVPAEALGFEGAEPGTKLKFALKNNIAGKIGYNQLIFNNSYLVSIKAAKMYRDYVNLQLAAVKQTVRNQVTDAYLPALVLTESIDVLNKNIETQLKLFKEMQETYKAGFIEQLDVDRIEYLLSTLTTERESQIRQRDILVDALKFSMNMPLTTDLTLSDDVDQVLLHYGDINAEEAIDYRNRPEYVALLKARELNEVQIEVYQKDWLPTVSLFASYDPSFQGNEKLFWIPSAIVGLSVNMPLYDGGLSRAKEERAIIAAMKVDEQKNTLTRGIDLEIESARKQYASAKQKMTDQEHNLALAQRINDTAQIKFKNGVGSSFEVSQAQTGYFQAQALFIASRFDYLKSIVAIQKALGKV